MENSSSHALCETCLGISQLNVSGSRSFVPNIEDVPACRTPERGWRDAYLTPPAQPRVTTYRSSFHPDDELPTARGRVVDPFSTPTSTSVTHSVFSSEAEAFSSRVSNPFLRDPVQHSPDDFVSSTDSLSVEPNESRKRRYDDLDSAWVSSSMSDPNSPSSF